MKPVLALFVIGCIVGTAVSLTSIPAGRLPEKRFEILAVYDNDNSIYLLGGVSEQNKGVRDILKYNILTEKLELVGQFPDGLSQGTAHLDVTSGNIYYFGGEYSNPSTKSSAVFEINIKNTVQVTKVGNLPVGIASHCSVSNGNPFYYILGGYTTELQKQTFEYDARSHSTLELNNTDNIQRTSSACVGANLKTVYVFGGYANGFQSVVVEYDVLNGVATTLDSTFAFGITGSTGVRNGNHIYVVGGGNGSPVQQKHKMSLFDVSTKQLTSLTVDGLRNNLYRTGAVYVAKLNRIYVFGGREYGVREGVTETVDEISYIQL